MRTKPFHYNHLINSFEALIVFYFSVDCVYDEIEKSIHHGEPNR